jgi:rhodanese-related sulfurtransferase
MLRDVFREDTMRYMTAFALAFGLCAAPAAASDLADEIGGYLDFAGYTEGVIQPEQLTADILPGVTFVDVRAADEFAADAIDGAINIEWREIVARAEDLPESGFVVVYCNTAVLSSQAMLVARLMGHENVLVLQGGRAAFQP